MQRPTDGRCGAQRKHGWRHAKRPGVDEFLETLCQYYEIVIFSQNYGAEEIVAKLDPKVRASYLLRRKAVCVLTILPTWLSNAHCTCCPATRRGT